MDSIIALFKGNIEIIKEWEVFFCEIENVTILKEDVSKVSCDALVSPTNYFGFMDGGIDYAISMRLGWNLQYKLQKIIRNLPEKALLVSKHLLKIQNPEDGLNMLKYWGCLDYKSARQ